MKLRRQSHAVYKTQYHIVWVTKYRKDILNTGVQKYVRERLHEVKEHYEDIEYFSIGMDHDHIHIHMMIPPKYSVSKIVQLMKSNTSRKMKDTFLFLKSVYWGTDSVWSKGYFVSTVGINEKVISNYVQMQGKEEVGQAELEFN